MIKSINPATGQITKVYDELDHAGIEAALAAAYHGAQSWKNVDLARRCQLVHALANILETTAGASARLMSTEMGKTLKAGLAEVDKCVRYCRYTADMAGEYLADEMVETEYKQAFTRPLPLGTVLLVMPWNFPFWQVIRVAVAAILAGNTCLLKHASNVPGSALMLEELFLKAGFPAGVFQTLLIRAGAVKAILEDDRIQAASVTGSEAAGAAVAGICGARIKPCVLELGGVDPFIVMPSANLATAAANAITGRMRNNGQSCIAAKRLIVHADIYEDFKQMFLRKMHAMKLGNPLDTDTDMGPIASRRALDEAQGQIAGAEAQGATITHSAHILPDQGFYMRPAIIEGITKDMDVYGQEIFAPVAMLFKVANLDEAIALANDTKLGLSSVLFSNNKAEQIRAINELQAGSTYINRYASSDIRLPFGGIKRSGFGREMARQGLREFTNLKTVIVNRA